MPFLALKLYVSAMDAQTDGVKYRCTFQTGCKPVSPNSDGAGANMINLLLLCVLAATFEKEFKEKQYFAQGGRAKICSGDNATNFHTSPRKS